MAHYNLQRLIDYFNISLDEDGLDTQNKGHIQHLRIDSRLVESDDLFIALKGHTSTVVSLFLRPLKLAQLRY